MSSISNDQELRAALEKLPLADQRLLGARFAASVLNLSNNDRLAKVAETAMEPDLADTERDETFKTAKSIAVQTYTACGSDADWAAQAEHFVAMAYVAVLTPEPQIVTRTNLAWKAAIQARMAKNCAMIENDAGDVQNEAVKQYEIAADFIA